MVKIALLLSGRLRYTNDSISSLVGAIIEPLKPHIFCSFWQPENPPALDRLISILNPQAVELEDQSIIRPYLDELFQYNVHANMPSMSYKFYRVNQLRKIYETQQQCQCDVVIQARTDNIFFEKLDLARCQLALDTNSILCANQGYNQTIDDYIPQPRMVDNFYLGPACLIDKANMSFWYLRQQAEIYTKNNQLHHVRIPEIIQSKIWQDLGIKIGGLPGTGHVGNFWYDIDRRETPWR